jgi:hypothetical protein
MNQFKGKTLEIPSIIELTPINSAYLFSKTKLNDDIKQYTKCIFFLSIKGSNLHNIYPGPWSTQFKDPFLSPKILTKEPAATNN